MWEIQVDGKKWNGEAMVETVEIIVATVATIVATVEADPVEGIVMIRIVQDMERLLLL